MSNPILPASGIEWLAEDLADKGCLVLPLRCKCVIPSADCSSHYEMIRVTCSVYDQVEPSRIDADDSHSTETTVQVLMDSGSPDRTHREHYWVPAIPSLGMHTRRRMEVRFLPHNCG